jgi:formate dehydrogenase subunit gamma
MSIAVETRSSVAPAATVLRFTRTERAVHWVHAVTFLTLLATGFILSISVLQGLVGHRALLREIHLASAFFFVFGPGLIIRAGNRASFKADSRAMDQWSADDVRWLAHPSVDPTPKTPPQGKFNAGQKLNGIFTVYATFAFGLTGVILWQNRRFPYPVVTQANTIHTALAYIALAVFMGHLYLAVIHPATRHALQGMVGGHVRADWAQHHHRAWSASAAEGPLSLRGVAETLLLLVLGLEIAALVTRVAFIFLGANATDPVTSAIYHWSALPGTLSNTPTGVHLLDLAAMLWAGFLILVRNWIAARRGHPSL